jgi:hypothetical protein
VEWRKFDTKLTVTDPAAPVVSEHIPESVSFLVHDNVDNVTPSGFPRMNVMLTDPDGNKSIRPREVNKFWFGIGDSISGSCDFHGEFQATPSAPATHSARFYPTVRGWKYGILNAFEVRTSAAFRRDRYGQLRDMLEQRLDSRFFNIEDERKATGRTKGLKESPIMVKFIDADTGDTTLPALTHCQNLSTFATSSLPYFDGQMRDRTTDPDENSDFVVTN